MLSLISLPKSQFMDLMKCCASLECLTDHWSIYAYACDIWNTHLLMFFRVLCLLSLLKSQFMDLMKCYASLGCLTDHWRIYDYKCDIWNTHLLMFFMALCLISLLKTQFMDLMLCYARLECLTDLWSDKILPLRPADGAPIFWPFLGYYRFVLDLRTGALVFVTLFWFSAKWGWSTVFKDDCKLLVWVIHTIVVFFKAAHVLPVSFNGITIISYGKAWLTQVLQILVGACALLCWTFWGVPTMDQESDRLRTTILFSLQALFPDFSPGIPRFGGCMTLVEHWKLFWMVVSLLFSIL